MSECRSCSGEPCSLRCAQEKFPVAVEVRRPATERSFKWFFEAVGAIDFLIVRTAGRYESFMTSATSRNDASRA